MFDPTLGRWLQEDPAGFHGGDLNLYRALDNNPDGQVDPTGLAGEVTSIRIEGRSKESEKRLNGFFVEFKITVRGRNLTELEYTQYVSSKTQIWGGTGKEFSKDEIYALYKESKIQFFPWSDPFASNVKDKGFGDGDKWQPFGNNTLDVIEDVHQATVPHLDPFGKPKSYAFRQTRSMVFKVREKCGGTVLEERKWSFTWQNFSGDSPTSPVEDKDVVGFYDYSGIESLPWDKKPGKK